MDHGFDGFVQTRTAALNDIGCQSPGTPHKPQNSCLHTSIQTVLLDKLSSSYSHYSQEVYSTRQSAAASNSQRLQMHRYDCECVHLAINFLPQATQRISHKLQLFQIY